MLGKLIPSFTDFTDEQIIQAGVQFLKKDEAFVRSIVQSPQGQLVLSQLRETVSEQEANPSIMHRCPNCDFAHEIEVFHRPA